MRGSVLTVFCGLFLAPHLSAALAQGALPRLPPPQTYDICVHLARELGNPFIELDGRLCIQALDIERARKSPRYEAARAARCAAVATQTGNAAVATNPQLCSTEASKLTSGLRTDWNHPARAAMRNVVESIVTRARVGQMQSFCSFLAERQGNQASTLDSSTCDKLASDQYLTDPTRFVSDYRTYCQALAAAHFPQMKQTDAMRVCPDVSQTIEIQQINMLRNLKVEKDFARKAELKSLRNYAVAGVLIAAFVFVFFFLPSIRDKAKQKKQAAKIKIRSAAALTAFGTDPDIREKLLIDFFEKRNGTVKYTEDLYKTSIHLKFTISRALITLSPGELTAMRIAFLLFNRGLMHPSMFDEIRFGTIYGDGAGNIEDGDVLAWYPGNEVSGMSEALNVYSRARGISKNGAINLAIQELQICANDHEKHPTVDYLSNLIVGGNNWLRKADLPGTVFERNELPDGKLPPALLLGNMKDGSGDGLFFAKGGALITIAPPGAGKTQAQVLPNLVLWRGAAIVLDLKGDLFPATRGWRTQNVGPVYKFAPLDPDNSDCFNPLALVRHDVRNLWEDSRFLADLFVVRTGSKDRFWEERARDVLTAVIAYACYRRAPANRTMNTLHSLVNRIGWAEFIAELCTTSDVDAMKEEGHSLEKMEEKILDGVLQTLKVTLQPWAGQRVREVTKRCDWHPLDLRSDKKPTIYLSLRPGEVDAFASVLRVFVGLHIRALTADLPPRDASPILLMLDEMPRLRYMPPIEEALETGRQYGLWLWMFVQSLGQMKQAYANADGMVGSCAVRCYMNPSAHDGTTERISKELGQREGAIDGQRKDLVEATDLTGPDYKDDVIVFSTGSKPARVAKTFAYLPPFAERLNLPDKKIPAEASN